MPKGHGSMHWAWPNMRFLTIGSWPLFTFHVFFGHIYALVHWLSWPRWELLHPRSFQHQCDHSVLSVFKQKGTWPAIVRVEMWNKNHLLHLLNWGISIKFLIRLKPAIFSFLNMHNFVELPCKLKNVAYLKFWKEVSCNLLIPKKKVNSEEWREDRLWIYFKWCCFFLCPSDFNFLFYNRRYYSKIF